jgi:hypothetical protein
MYFPFYFHGDILHEFKSDSLLCTKYKKIPTEKDEYGGMWQSSSLFSLPCQSFKDLSSSVEMLLSRNYYNKVTN